MSAAARARYPEMAMSTVNIPAGQSLREVAERLGLPVEELQTHAGLEDVEAPQEIDRVFEIPDGFLREQDRDRRTTQAAVPRTRAQQGLNAVVALELEYRRTRVAGGIHAFSATGEETDGLAEARRAFERLEPGSNRLAIDLWKPLTLSKAIPVRAEAYAGRAIAHSLRHVLFGESAIECRKAALSSAKSAVMADPKLPAAHIAMGLALALGGMGEDDNDDHDDAGLELERAVELGEQDAWAWTWLAFRLEDEGEHETAVQAAQIANELDPHNPVALERLALAAEREGDTERAEMLYGQAIAARPTYANPGARLAALLSHAGRHDEAQAAWTQAVAQTESDDHRARLAALSGLELPPPPEDG